MSERPDSPPRRAPSPEAVRALREAAVALDVEEILDLCYAFAKDPIRLTVYLEALRLKGSRKAQAGACLICFDLARQGDARAEQEFLALVPVIQAYAAPDETGAHPMARLIEGSPYLVALWSDLERRLTAMDPRVEASSPSGLAPNGDVIELDLFDDADLLEIELEEVEEVSANDDRLRAEWDATVERFFSWERMSAQASTGRPRLLNRPAFGANTKEELARIEAFRNDALSFANHVEAARELLPCVELFLAAHTRAKNLFGRRNPARDALLEAGLAHFAALPAPPWEAFAWLLPPTGAPFAWEKVAELLMDFSAFLAATPQPVGASPEALAQAYVKSNRPQPPPPLLSAKGERRRR